MYVRGIVTDVDKDKGKVYIEGMSFSADRRVLDGLQPGDEIIAAVSVQWRRRRDDGRWFGIRQIVAVSRVGE